MDRAFALLANAMAKSPDTTLLALDENIRAPDLARIPRQSKLITNRYEIRDAAKAAGLDCDFSDFDFSAYPEDHFTQVAFRVAKEKPVTHHIINQAARLLAPGGRLLLSGAKNEGIKSYAKSAATLLQTSATISKEGTVYLAVIEKVRYCRDDLLDDKNYTQLRPAVTTADTTFYSKPGIFGWNKIDQGSLLLTKTLPDFFNLFATPPTTILDLGCGYGLLSVMASQWVTATFVATDNNAAAVVSCKKNFSNFGIAGEVIADDCARNISQKFTAVLCHPPFHRGFDTEGQLTEDFIQAASVHLKAGGMALFVANQFVPLESVGAKYFSTATRIAEDKSFKVVLLANG